MLLGTGESRRTNVNHLQGAFHPDHGLVWTDGRCVNLTVVTVHQDDVITAPPTILGQFDSVEHVSWSSHRSQCYLSVQHTQSVTVWSVDPSGQKLKFDKVAEIQKQLINQGCLWHPTMPCLVLLSQDQIQLLDAETLPDSVQELGLDHGITAGSWTVGGSKLIAALDRDIRVYKLDENKRLVQTCMISSFSGPIRRLVSLTPDLVAMVHDLPLKELVIQSQADLFEAVPLDELHIAKKPEKLVSELRGESGRPQMKVDSRREVTLERELLETSGPVDVNAFIRRRDRNQTCDADQSMPASPERHQTNCESASTFSVDGQRGGSFASYTRGQELGQVSTVTSAVAGMKGLRIQSGACQLEASKEIINNQDGRWNLTSSAANQGFKFKRSERFETAESCQLFLVNVEGQDEKSAENSLLSSMDVPCLINPDLLVYQINSQALVVGSNTQQKVFQVFVENRKSLQEFRRIDLNLSESERCLGLCTLPCTSNLLLLTGDTSNALNTAFLPSSSKSEYQLKLRIVQLLAKSAGIIGEKKKCTNGSDNDPYPLTLPSGGRLSNTTSLRPTIIEELPRCPTSKDRESLDTKD